MEKALINKIIPFSSVDGPGNRLAIFFQGCNFNCLYCHNPETINICSNCGACIINCKKNALTYNEMKKIEWDSNSCINCDECLKICSNYSSPKIMKMTTDEVIEKILKVKNFIQGITTSGGECTLNEKFLVELFKKVKKIGLTCYLDSNGSMDFEKMKELTEVTDKVMLDIKAWDKDEHIKLTGKSNDIIIKNLNYLSKKDKLFEVRTVVVPELLNNEFTVHKVSEFLGKYNSKIRYKLIKYRPLGVRKELIQSKIPSNEYMEELKRSANENGVEDVVIV